jgi:hypothetical protein
MPEKRVMRWNSGAKWNDPGLVWGPLAAEPPSPILTPQHSLDLNSTTAMEYWEITLDRSQKTLPVWQTHLPTLKIGTLGTAELEGLIDGFEPLVQARVAAQDVYDEAFRDVQSALLKMKILGTKVPVLIEGHLEENERLMKAVDDLYRTNPRTEGTILKRARELFPVWERANTAMAALTPTQPPIVRAVQGMAHTAAMLKALVDGYADLIKTLEEKEELLNSARENLRAHDREADRLNKRWYRTVKQGTELTEALTTALEGIPTEPSTPAPDPIEIASVTQGGEEGRQALVAYVAGGGGHGTLKELQITLPGDAEPFTRKVPLDASGNALGPYPEGTVVTMRTSVSNSAGTRTSAPRTITIGPPIE